MNVEGTYKVDRSLASYYYRNFFPWDEFSLLLNLPEQPGFSPEIASQYRELSFSHGNRFHSFENITKGSDCLREFCGKTPPRRIDIGPFYNLPPPYRVLGLPQFEANASELRIDIDITDYDGFRSCTGPRICSKCKPLLKLAVRLTEFVLRSRFDFHSLFWTFSGRRGVHCWVLDPKAAFLSASQRAEVADFFSLFSEALKKPRIEGVSEKFKSLVLDKFLIPAALELHSLGALVLGSEPLVKKTREFSTLLPEATSKLFNKFLDQRSPRWDTLPQILDRDSQLALFSGLLFPKIDKGVTKEIRHLLRAPFSIRDDNGCLVLPFDVSELDTFNFESPVSVESLDEPGFKAFILQRVLIFKASLLCRDPRAQYLICRKCFTAQGQSNIRESSSVKATVRAMREHCSQLHPDEKLDGLMNRTVVAEVDRLCDKYSSDPQARVRWFEEIFKIN